MSRMQAIKEHLQEEGSDTTVGVWCVAGMLNPVKCKDRSVRNRPVHGTGGLPKRTRQHAITPFEQVRLAKPVAAFPQLESACKAAASCSPASFPGPTTSRALQGSFSNPVG